MQTTEINGFVIDQFNVHSLQEGKKQGVCPDSKKCRKPKNHNKQCASYDWERGLGCLLYTSPSPRDRQKSRMPSSA